VGVYRVTFDVPDAGPRASATLALVSDPCADEVLFLDGATLLARQP
jgi:hypothetical protein